MGLSSRGFTKRRDRRRSRTGRIRTLRGGDNIFPREARAAAGPNAGRRTRIWEIDFLRGLAIILMVGYHILFDLGEFNGVKRFLGFSTDLSSAAWTAAQYLFAGLFVVLSGISSTMSRSNLRRGLKLLVLALAVTAVTWVFEPSSAVLFGILHCLALSILLYGAAFERKGPAACAAWGAVILGLGALLPTMRQAAAISSDWLLPLGIYGPSFASYDYFPLLPWFGVFLAGAALGKRIYAPGRSLIPRPPGETFINTAGRHSLLIYLVHQPVIMAVLYLVR
jgi:uncharacterized membrane protein